MRRCPYTLTPKDVQLQARHVCQQHLKLADHGRKCTVPVLLAVLFSAAARITSIAAACAALRDAPSDQAVRDALLATLPQTHARQRRIHRALASGLPKALQRRRQVVAADLVLVPSHGEPLDDPAEVYRSQPRHGTRHCHAYATAYVVRKGCRWTVALTAVAKGASLDEVLKRLLRQAAKAGVRARYVLLDRGFSSVDVIRYLQAARTPFLMPVVGRGRKADHPKGPSDARVFATWKRSGRGRYTLTNKDQRTAPVSICVKCRNYRGQWKRHGRQALVYGYWGLRPSSAPWVHETYRRRFGIASSYRPMHQARIRTCTRSPLLRLLYVGVALILRNVWVWLHREVLARGRRGGRMDLNRLVFRQMLVWLQHVIEEQFGVYDIVATERPLLA
jgi:hypothetical protein